MSGYPYISRSQEERLQSLFKTFPVVVVVGARQVGKSTLLEHLYPSFPRIVFDPVIDVEGAKADPDIFLNNRPSPIILDEIQYVPELVPAIKRRLEKDKRPGQYLVTGSQQWNVMRLLSESLAGRCVFVDLEALSLFEIVHQGEKRGWVERWLEEAGEIRPQDIKQLPSERTLFERLWRGFLPEAQFLALEHIPPFHAAYQRTYIERDVRLLADISDLMLFSRFYRLCAALTAQEINFSELGRELGIHPQTAGRWVDILKATFQWFEVPPYSGSAIKRLSDKPKGYFADTGLMAATQAISAPEVIGSHPLWGAFWETAVVAEIRKQCRLLKRLPNLYHWRTHAGAEVDLILEYDGHFFPMEIKGKSHPTARDASGITAFRKTYPKLSIKPGLIIAPAESFYGVTKIDFVMPWDAV